MSMYVRLTSGRKISGLFEKLMEISGHFLYVQCTFLEHPWRPAGAPEKTNPLLFVENYSLRSHFVNVLVNNYVAACLRLEKKSNVMNVQVDIDAGRTFRLHADVNVERTSLSLRTF